MIPYIFVSLMPLCLSFFFQGLHSVEECVKHQSRKKYIYCIGIILFAFLAIRSRELGSQDTINYYNMMKRAIFADTWSDYYNPNGVETGFQLLVFALSRLFDNPQMIIVFSSAVIVFGTCYFVYHNCEDLSFGITMYITLGLMIFQMQGMRQAIAMSICLIAYEYVKKRQILPFIILLLLAMCFHRTVIVFIIVYFVSFIRYSWKGMTLVFASSVAVLLLSDRIIGLANDLFDTEYGTAVEGGGLVATALYVIILAFAVLFNKDLGKDKNQDTIFYLTVTAFVCYVMRYVGALASERISFYFMFWQIPLLSSTVEKLSENEKSIVKAVCYAMMIALFVYRLNGSDLVPYDICFSW